ncbi:MAG: gluconokinase [Propionicimonas sp.]|nr:gluconokinase [Propionicimonas sp.]
MDSSSQSADTPPATHLVVMGVAGSGKSTLARALADRLGWTFAEGDDFHSTAAVARMHAGVPLTDQERWPWLDRIAAWTADQDARGRSTVVTCSALRRVYRDRLRAAPGRTVFLHLTGSPAVLARRMVDRRDHFMPASLLPSQLTTLEPLAADEAGFSLDIDRPRTELVDLAVARLRDS